MHKDTVVGILGAVILVAAMVGIFWYEGTQVPSSAAGGGGSGPLSFTWAESTVGGPSQTGSTQEGASTDVTVMIDQANLTAVAFILTWTDDVANSGPDDFDVTVTGPNGETGSGTGSSGTIRVEITDLGTVPTQESGTQADLDALASMAGTGNWTVTVTLNNAGDVGPGPLPPTPVTQDTGNGWTLATDLSVYAAEVA